MIDSAAMISEKMILLFYFSWVPSFRRGEILCVPVKNCTTEIFWMVIEKCIIVKGGT